MTIASEPSTIVDDLSFGGLDSKQAQLSLEIAAALGPRVVFREWELACSLRRISVSSASVDALVACDLAHRDDDAWRFNSSELAEAFQRLAREQGRWSRHHAACAQALFELYGAHSGGVARRRAQHLLEAGKRRAAMGPLLEAAREAYDAGDFSKSLEYLERQWDLLNEFDVPDDDPRRAQNLWRRAHRLFVFGKSARALALVEESLGILGDGHWAAEAGEAALLHGRLLRDDGDLVKASVRFREALGHFAAAGDEHGLARCRAAQGAVEMLRGQLAEARVCFLDALGAFDALEDDFMVASVLTVIGRTWIDSGEPDKGVACLERARRIAQREGHRPNEASAWSALGDVAREEGDWGEARRCFEEAARLFEEGGNKRLHLVRFNLALVELGAHNFDEARRLLDEVADAYPTIGFKSRMPLVYAAKMACAAGRGDWERFDDLIERVETRVAETALIHSDLATVAEKAARLADGRGAADKCRRALALAVEQFEQLGQTERVERLREQLG